MCRVKTLSFIVLGLVGCASGPPYDAHKPLERDCIVDIDQTGDRAIARLERHPVGNAYAYGDFGARVSLFVNYRLMSFDLGPWRNTFVLPPETLVATPQRCQAFEPLPWDTG